MCTNCGSPLEMHPDRFGCPGCRPGVPRRDRDDDELREAIKAEFGRITQEEARALVAVIDDWAEGRDLEWSGEEPGGPAARAARKLLRIAGLAPSDLDPDWTSTGGTGHG